MSPIVNDGLSLGDEYFEGLEERIGELAPPTTEPNARGCPAAYHSPFCECLASHEANRLILAAKELLQLIDRAPIRTAAVKLGLPLYERAADLIDAVAKAERWQR